MAEDHGVESPTLSRPTFNMDFDKKVERIRKDYASIKYELPDIDKLDEDFGILSSLDKYTFILRDIEVIIAKKYSHYIQFFESLRNPKNNSPIFLAFLKSFNDDDLQEIMDIHNELSKEIIKNWKLDVVYSEENTAKTILEHYNNWQTLKFRILKILEKGNIDLLKRDKSENNSNYFC